MAYKEMGFFGWHFKYINQLQYLGKKKKKKSSQVLKHTKLFQF